MTKNLHDALRCTVLALALAAAWPAAATDVAVIDRAESEGDHRRDFSRIVLRAALERTTNEYGPYRIAEAPMFMERARLFNTLKAGQLVNIVSMLANKDWLDKLPFVPVPIDLGLQSWRLLLTNARSVPRLRRLASEGHLAQARVGVGSTWALRQVLEDNRYHTVTGNSYEGLFLMLRAQRFEYLPRSVNDVFDEYENHRAPHPGLTVEESIVLYAPVPMLFFVAPTEHRLRRRVEKGMEAMLKDGSLAQLVLTHFHADLDRARLCERVRIDLPNKQLPPSLSARRALWLDPFDPRYAICPRRHLRAHE